MNTKKRLGKPWNELRDELYADDPEMEARVRQGVEELRIRAKLHAARKEAGLTQDQVAERMRVNRSYVSRLENHPENMKLATLNKYAQAVGMRVEIALHA